MDSNRSALYRSIAETTFGTPPTNPVFTGINFTGESLKHEKATVLSELILPTRNILDLIEVGANVTGEFAFELQAAGACDWMFENALKCVPVTVNETGTMSIVAADNKLSLDAGSWAVTPIPGMFLKVAGFTNNANNGVFGPVVSADANDIVFPASTFIADDAAQAGASIKGTAYKNGITQQFRTIERVLPGAASTFYQAYTGCALDELSINLESMAITKGSASWNGKVGDSRDAILTGATYVAGSTAKVLNGTRHVASLKRAGATITEYLKALSFNLRNNQRPKDALATFGPFDIGMGKFEITGSINAYFESKGLLDAFLAH